MTAERLSMDKIRKILWLYFSMGMRGSRTIASAAACSKTSVNECLNRAHERGVVTWKQIDELDDAKLEELLGLVAIKAATAKALPDWRKIDEELRRRDHQVTLKLLWEEYRAEHADGYGYTQFWKFYTVWKNKQSLVMRQVHRAGEKTFVDFCDGLKLTNPYTGELTKTHLFVGALGASSFTYAYAVPSQSVPHFIECHQRMYEHFQGVSAITVPDNLKSAVTRPNRYEPQINGAYAEMAEHYGTAIIPARVRKPRDKGKVEAAVLVAERWILAVLRDRTFYSLQEMNEEIARLLDRLNNKIMRHRKQSRRQLWEMLDRPALKPLPVKRYELADWKMVRLNIDYHFTYDNHLYSAPSALAGEELQVRATMNTIEVIHKHNRVASHRRSYQPHRMTTVPEHMPSSHRRYAEWTPTRMIDWANEIAPVLGSYVNELLKRKRHPEQGFRSAMGLIGLAKKHGNDRLVKAVQRAVVLGLYSYMGVNTMLANRMESAPLPSIVGACGADDAQHSRQIDLLAAENIRGQSYYQ
jgi:transposase